jgi:hypothetical protein
LIFFHIFQRRGGGFWVIFGLGLRRAFGASQRGGLRGLRRSVVRDRPPMDGHDFWPTLRVPTSGWRGLARKIRTKKLILEGLGIFDESGQ